MRTKEMARRMLFEKLENRQMLAGGSVGLAILAGPMAQVANQPVPILDILPGGQDKVLAELKISTFDRQYARLTEVLAVPAWTSESLAQNTQGFTLRADLNGKAKDGCEAVLAYAWADYETDLVDFKISRSIWLQPSAAPLRLQVVANFNLFLTGEVVGVDVAQVCFNDLRNNPVPDWSVEYTGAAPTLHTMENKMFSISQNPMAPAGTVLVGQQDVELIQFSTWGNEGVALKYANFVAGQGNLSNATNYTLWADYDWDGSWDLKVVSSAVSEKEIVFTFAPDAVSHSGALYEVHADIVNVLPVDSRIQLVFPSDGSGLTAVDVKTGKPLRGVQLNGSGEGQIRLWQWPQWSTAYRIVKDPELFVKEVPTDTPYAYAAPGTPDIVLDVFSVFDANDITINSVVISAADGSLDYCTNYVLWKDNDGDGNVDTKVARGELAWKVGDNSRIVYFGNLGQSQLGGQSVRYEVHADVLDDLAGYNVLRTRLDGIEATRSNGDPLTVDKIFTVWNRQTYWMFWQPEDWTEKG